MNKPNPKAPVVFVHGMWCNGTEFPAFARTMQDAGYTWHAPTLPGHGEAHPADVLEGLGIEDYVASLTRWMNANRIERPILIGHSMGGLLVQILAARIWCTAIVLVAPSPPAQVSVFCWSALRSILPFLRWGFWKRRFRPSLSQAGYALLHRLPAAERVQVHRKLGEESGRALSQIAFPQSDKTRAAAVDAEKVQAPMLVLAGAEDRITPPASVQAIAAYYAQARYHCLGKHAHWLLAEPGSEAVHRLILNWLKNCDMNTPPLADHTAKAHR